MGSGPNTSKRVCIHNYICSPQNHIHKQIMQSSIEEIVVEWIRSSGLDAIGRSASILKTWIKMAVCRGSMTMETVCWCAWRQCIKWNFGRISEIVICYIWILEIWRNEFFIEITFSLRQNKTQRYCVLIWFL